MIKGFFNSIEMIWAAVPNYVKVFFYSVTSSSFGLWVAGELDWRAVAIIVATNIGIYGVPRTVGGQVKKML